MIVTIIVGAVSFVIGVGAGILFTNLAINDAIARRMGW